jgi:hypothetical protein
MQEDALAQLHQQVPLLLLVSLTRFLTVDQGATLGHTGRVFPDEIVQQRLDHLTEFLSIDATLAVRSEP